MADSQNLKHPGRSVVGTVTIPANDPDLSLAKAEVRTLFEASLERTARQLAEWGGADAEGGTEGSR